MSREDLIRRYQELGRQAERAGLMGKLAVIYDDFIADLQRLDGADFRVRMMTTADAAPYLGVAPETVAEWCRQGRLTGARRTSGTTGDWRIPSTTVYGYLQH